MFTVLDGGKIIAGGADRRPLGLRRVLQICGDESNLVERCKRDKLLVEPGAQIRGNLELFTIILLDRGDVDHV